MYSVKYLLGYNLVTFTSAFITTLHKSYSNDFILLPSIATPVHTHIAKTYLIGSINVIGMYLNIDLKTTWSKAKIQNF